MSALNAGRMLNITGCGLAGTAEKLATGYKINRAADDAAGLSISEKMRKKIRGLERGMENVQDGISLCQVADGALNEVAELLQRARELSIQAYNDTNSKRDRHTI
ncbi:MAG: flagellar hook protein, partial [Lachnospiraceae bacterium]|nr:flagellar hook protein [Lachnospiraceae bacterium]